MFREDTQVVKDIVAGAVSTAAEVLICRIVQLEKRLEAIEKQLEGAGTPAKTIIKKDTA